MSLYLNLSFKPKIVEKAKLIPECFCLNYCLKMNDTNEVGFKDEFFLLNSISIFLYNTKLGYSLSASVHFLKIKAFKENILIEGIRATRPDQGLILTTTNLGSKYFLEISEPSNF